MKLPIVCLVTMLLLGGLVTLSAPRVRGDNCTGQDFCNSGTIFSERAGATPCGGSSVCVGMAGDERKMFFANGRFWSFFENNLNSPAGVCDAFYLWASSTDGITWTFPNGDRCQASTGMKDASAGFIRGHTFAVDSDGTFAYVAHGYVVANAATGPIEFRRGTLNADGTITWDAAGIQTVVASGVDACWQEMAIAADRNTGAAKRITIMAMKSVNCAAATFIQEQAYSSSSDGTGAWSKSDIETACPSGNCNTQSVLAQLNSNNILMVYADAGAADGSRTLFSRLITGGVTAARVTVDSIGALNTNNYQVVGDAAGNAYFGYIQGVSGGNHALLYRTYTGGVWSAATTLAANIPTASAANSITIDTGIGTGVTDYRIYIMVTTTTTTQAISRRGGTWDAALVTVTTCPTSCTFYGSMAYSNAKHIHLWAYAQALATDPHNVQAELLSGSVPSGPPPKPLDIQTNSALLLFLFASWAALFLYAAVWIHRRRSGT